MRGGERGRERERERERERDERGREGRERTSDSLALRSETRGM
jgi:hypothetical protein